MRPSPLISTAHISVLPEIQLIRYETWKKEEKNYAWRSISLKKTLNSLRYTKKTAVVMKKMVLLK